MSNPVVIAVAQSQSHTNATSHTVNLPASIAAGDHLVLWIGYDSTNNHSVPGGWTQIGSTANNTDSSALYYRLADGTEGSTITVGTTNSETLTAQVWQVRGGTYSAGGTDGYTATVHVPPLLAGEDATPTNYLSLFFFRWDGGRTVDALVADAVYMVEEVNTAGDSTTATVRVYGYAQNVILTDDLYSVGFASVTSAGVASGVGTVLFKGDAVGGGGGTKVVRRSA